MRPSRPLRFLFEPSTRGSGTTVMRGEQLSELFRSSGRAPGSVSFEPVTPALTQSDLFLTKGAARSVTPDTVQEWQRRGNRVLLDPVDEVVADDVAAAADIVIAASATAFTSFAQRWPSTLVRRVDHHVDPRVRKVRASASRRRRLRTDPPVIRYFGEPLNAIRTPRIERVVDFVHVDTSRRGKSWLAHLPGTDMHYAVRSRRGLDHHKPFLKGFTAAAMGAVVFLSRDEHEAAHWLPADYPFWIDAAPEEDTIMDALYRAHQSYASPTWQAAHAAMRSIAALTTDAVVARQLSEALA